MPTKEASVHNRHYAIHRFVIQLCPEAVSSSLNIEAFHEISPSVQTLHFGFCFAWLNLCSLRYSRPIFTLVLHYGFGCSNSMGPAGSTHGSGSPFGFLLPSKLPCSSQDLRRTAHPPYSNQSSQSDMDAPRYQGSRLCEKASIWTR